MLAGAFAAPDSTVQGLLVLIAGTCAPGLLTVVWRSGSGYRRSFVAGAAAPCIICSYRLLADLGAQSFPGTASLPNIVFWVGTHRGPQALVLLLVALGGGAAGIGVHWLMNSSEDNSDDDAF